MIELPRLALSVQQPWAWLIVRPDVEDRRFLFLDPLWKDVENRDWPTKVRGEFCVHAGKRFDHDGYEAVLDRLEGALTLPKPSEYQMGGIIGKATLRDCVTRWDSPLWFTGKFGFVLQSSTPLPFMPCRGQLGFFAHGILPELSEREAPP